MTIKLSQMRFRLVSMDSLQVLTKQELLEGASTCKLEFGECCVLDKKIKDKFGTALHRMGGPLDCVHTNV